jgi:hypothetical protein
MDSTARAAAGAGFTGIIPYAWCKTNQHVSRPQLYTPALELMLIGWKPGPHAHKWFGTEATPQEKVNYILADTIRGSQKVQNPEKREPLNPCQKPSVLAKTLAQRHTTRGQWAIVLCAGQGGEVMGCLDAGLNVMAFEIDPEQMKGLHASLLSRQTGSDNEIVRQIKEHAERQRKEKLEKTQRAAARKLRKKAKLQKAALAKQAKQTAAVSKTSSSSSSSSKPAQQESVVDQAPLATSSSSTSAAVPVETPAASTAPATDALDADRTPPKVTDLADWSGPPSPDTDIPETEPDRWTSSDSSSAEQPPAPARVPAPATNNKD